MREDFIDWGKDDVKHAIDHEAGYAYHGEKFKIFKKLREKYPDRTYLMPASSAMPTITVVRVKNVITGGISSLFETTSEFMPQEVFEDTLLDQIRNNADLSPSENIYYYGDYCW